MKRPTRRKSSFSFLPVALALIATTLSNAWGHEVRPAYLGLNEIGPNIFNVVWKQPLLNDRRLRLNPILPSQCRETSPIMDEILPGALFRTWQVHCVDAAFEKGTIHVAGLSGSLGDVWVVVRSPVSGRAEIRGHLSPSQSTMFLQRPNKPDVSSYFTLGMRHLLTGIDHILFIFGLMFFVRGLSSLLLTVTAFTLAHSITLVAATLGLASLPQGPVETCILLSILFLAVEASSPNREQTLTARMPWMIAFAFGLLHGFGFAGALQDIELPVAAVGISLLLFNLGIEVGQIVVVATLLASQQVFFRLLAPTPPWLTRMPIFAMGSIACYWLLRHLSLNWSTA